MIPGQVGVSLVMKQDFTVMIRSMIYGLKVKLNSLLYPHLLEDDKGFIMQSRRAAEIERYKRDYVSSL